MLLRTLHCLAAATTVHSESFGLLFRRSMAGILASARHHGHLISSERPCLWNGTTGGTIGQGPPRPPGLKGAASLSEAKALPEAQRPSALRRSGKSWFQRISGTSRSATSAATRSTSTRVIAGFR